MTVKRTENVEIVGSLVALLNATFEALTIVEDSPGVYTLTTLHTYHLQPTFTITIGVLVYKIKTVAQDASITIEGSAIPVLFSFPIPAPKYYHGTIIDATKQLTGVTQVRLVTPMVYCYEPIRQKIFNLNSPVDREVYLRLYFLTQANYETWKVSDYLNQALKQMMSLAHRFVEEVCEESPLIGIIEDYELVESSKMSVRKNDKEGSNLFDLTLSGVEMTITLPIMRQQC